MLTEQNYRGGSDTNGGAALAGGATLFLTDQLWCFLNTTGGAGDAIIVLPFARGLLLGTIFRFVFASSSDQNTVIRNNVSGTDLAIFDTNGVIRTAIDHSTGNWTIETAVEAVLTGNTTGNGTWLIYSWGTG